MAHGLATKNDMLYVGQTPWHGLGVRCDSAPSVADALRLANLGWTVSTQPIALARGTVASQIIDSHRAVVRDDTGVVLGVVTKKWRPVQNETTFGVFDPLIQRGELAIETAGMLDSGERVWALAKILRDPVEVTKGDAVIPYILLANSHCGDMAWHGMYTAVRVVCANTLGGALRGVKQAKEANQLLRFRHAGDVAQRVANVAGVIDVAHRSFVEAGQRWNAMAKKQLNEKSLKDYFRAIFPPAVVEKKDAAPKSAPRPVSHGLLESIAANTADPSRASLDDIATETELQDARCIDRLCDLFMAEESPEARGSLWAGVNAVTKWVTHERGGKGATTERDRAEARASNLLGGEGHAIIERAFAAANAVLTA